MAQIDDIIAACQQARDVLNKAEAQGKVADEALIEARQGFEKCRTAIDDYIIQQLGK